MGLHILVVGGGIAGLATALALRRAGHKVQVFEESQLEYENTVGSVVHLGPKSNDLLRSWGYDGPKARGVLVRDIDEFDTDGSLREKPENTQPGWMYYERSSLHKSLWNAAVSPTGPGQPVEISLGTRVEAATEAAQITLNDGTTVQGDVVIGADGLHSTVRKSVFKSENINGTARVTVHFSVPTSHSAPSSSSSSVIRRFHDQPERYEKWLVDNLQLNVYRVEPERLLFDCTIAIHGHAHITGSYIKQEILQALESGHPEFTRLISAVEPSDIHFWTQPSLPRVDEWIFKHLVLVGDAAHPFFPYELPGTSQALNDAAALAAELSLDVSVDEVEERLRSWEGPRKDRVRVIQQSERGLH